MTTKRTTAKNPMGSNRGANSLAQESRARQSPTMASPSRVTRRSKDLAKETGGAESSKPGESDGGKAAGNHSGPTAGPSELKGESAQGRQPGTGPTDGPGSDRGRIGRDGQDRGETLGDRAARSAASALTLKDLLAALSQPQDKAEKETAQRVDEVAREANLAEIVRQIEGAAASLNQGRSGPARAQTSETAERSTSWP